MRKPSLIESIIVLLSMVFFVSIGYGVFKLELQVMLLCTATFTALMAMRLGLSWTVLEKAISQRMVKVLPAVYIMFTVGGLIATFIYSGTIPMLIYYGLQIISPQFLIPCSFLICAILATATGTGWGSAGTAGVALIGIAMGLEIPLAPVAAAVVAGSTFGDKLSPLSDTTNMAALSAGTDLYAHVRSMLWTTIPAAVVTVIIYTVYGLRFGGDFVMPENVSSMLATMDQMYTWNPLLLIPFVIILLGSLLRKPTLPVMYIGIAVAVALGMIFQGFNLIPALNAWENVELPLIYQGVPASRRWERVEAALERTGVSHLRDKPTHALSYGQKKRVAIAGVLVMEPEVLILDEPTAGLDPQGVSDIMKLLTRLRDELGMTVLIATHDMDIVPLYCDYAYLLGGGKVLLEGTPETLFADPAALRANHLRLPRIAHLMEVLRDVDGLDTDRSAATIGAARREILRMLKEERP